MTDKKNNAKADLVAITGEQVDAAALFLHQQMNSRFSQQEWARCLRNSWADDAPNCGFMLLKDGEVVGAICALYSEQEIKGQRVKVCNPHTLVC